MKNAILYILLLLSYPVYSQFTSESFEDWENGNPVNWFTSNIAAIYVPITQSTDPRSGSFAVRGETIPTQDGLGFPPMLAAGEGGKGFPVNFRPEALRGWYKFHSDSGDAFTVSIAMIKNHQAIGSGGYFSLENTSVYKQFSANIFYNSAEAPDTIQMVILITNSVIKPGASFILDDLSLGDATDISETPGEFEYELAQNYPNPFNPSTIIQFQLPENEFVTLKVFNSIGQEVAVLINEMMSPGKYRSEFISGNLPAGVYVYKLQAGTFTQSRKMLVLK